MAYYYTGSAKWKGDKASSAGYLFGEQLAMAPIRGSLDAKRGEIDEPGFGNEILHGLTYPEDASNSRQHSLPMKDLGGSNRQQGGLAALVEYATPHRGRFADPASHHRARYAWTSSKNASHLSMMGALECISYAASMKSIHRTVYGRGMADIQIRIPLSFNNYPLKFLGHISDSVSCKGPWMLLTTEEQCIACNGDDPELRSLMSDTDGNCRHCNGSKWFSYQDSGTAFPASDAIAVVGAILDALDQAGIPHPFVRRS